MACLGLRDCAKKPTLKLTSHGVTAELCEEHRTKAIVFVASGSSGVKMVNSDRHVEDYVKLYMILKSNEMFRKVMLGFVQEAEKLNRTEGSTKVGVPLSLSMTNYEALCWFGDQKKVMSGLLSEAEFKRAIKHGYMVKDPGPGPDHGEFSHRLQWHYIMRVMTDDFKRARTRDWNLTPLELYCSMGEEGFARNIWGALLEGNGEMMASPGSPDWVNNQFTETKSPLSQTSFGTSILRRENKRANVVRYVTQQLPTLTDKKIHVNANQRKQPGETVVNVHDVVAILYRWRLTSPPDWVGGLRPENIGLDEKLAGQLWAGSGLTPGKAKGFGGARNPDESISDGLLLHNAQGMLTDSALEQRLAASRDGFNPAYKYAKKVGARRR